MNPSVSISCSSQSVSVNESDKERRLENGCSVESFRHSHVLRFRNPDRRDCPGTDGPENNCPFVSSSPALLFIACATESLVDASIFSSSFLLKNIRNEGRDWRSNFLAVVRQFSMSTCKNKCDVISPRSEGSDNQNGKFDLQTSEKYPTRLKLEK